MRSSAKPHRGGDPLFGIEAIDQVHDHGFHRPRHCLLEFVETLPQPMNSFLADTRLWPISPPEAAKPSPLKAKHLAELSLRFHESIGIEDLVDQSEKAWSHVFSQPSLYTVFTK
jgi:hypothetical protein